MFILHALLCMHVLVFAILYSSVEAQILLLEQLLVQMFAVYRKILLWNLSHMLSVVVDPVLAPNFKTTQL